MRGSTRRQRTTAFLTLLAFSTASCAIIPYPVIPDVDRFDHVHLAGDTLVSAGPRRLLERLSERIENAHPGLTIVDPIVFRDAAFPLGGWRIEELLDSERCRHLADGLDVRFLVLIGGGAEEVRDEMGIMMPLMMPLGAMSMYGTNVLSAVVLDLESGAPACRFRSEAEGPALLALWVIFVAAVAPTTGWAAERGLGAALIEFFADEANSGPLQIAVLAAEASGDPFVAYEGAPITVGRDIAVGEMVNRIAEVQEEATAGVSTREEIRSLLGVPLAGHSRHRVELYRFAAVAEGETRPLIYLGFFDWTGREARPYAGYLLVSYDEEWKVVDLDAAFVAAEKPPPEQTGGLPPSTRSSYDYNFVQEKTATVDGFRVEIEHLGDSTRERLYTDPEGDLVFEAGDWLDADEP